MRTGISPLFVPLVAFLAGIAAIGAAWLAWTVIWPQPRVYHPKVIMDVPKGWRGGLQCFDHYPLHDPDVLVCKAAPTPRPGASFKVYFH